MITLWVLPSRKCYRKAGSHADYNSFSFNLNEMEMSTLNKILNMAISPKMIESLHVKELLFDITVTDKCVIMWDNDGSFADLVCVCVPCDLYTVLN